MLSYRHHGEPLKGSFQSQQPWQDVSISTEQPTQNARSRLHRCRGAFLSGLRSSDRDFWQDMFDPILPIVSVDPPNEKNKMHQNAHRKSKSWKIGNHGNPMPHCIHFESSPLAIFSSIMPYFMRKPGGLSLRPAVLRLPGTRPWESIKFI